MYRASESYLTKLNVDAVHLLLGEYCGSQVSYILDFMPKIGDIAGDVTFSIGRGAWPKIAMRRWCESSSDVVPRWLISWGVIRGGYYDFRVFAGSILHYG